MSARGPGGAGNPRRAIRRTYAFGLVAVVLLVGAVGGWASTTELAGAVIAEGLVVVESNTKKVQHPTGGIVGRIFVQEGSEVEAGQVLVRLDDTVPRTTLGVVRSSLDTQLLREARLLAERDEDAEMAFPEELAARRDDPSVARGFLAERRLFEARRTTIAGQRKQLEEQVSQLDEQILGLVAQQKAKETEIELVGKELAGVTELYAKGLVSVSKMTELQRISASLAGDRGELIASVATARGKISEIELQVLQLDKDFQTSVLNDLRDAQSRIDEYRERETAAEDELRRIDILSPQNGTVHELTVHTVGGVIAAGETVMMIVPRADTLVIDAKIAPQDVDQVVVGASVGIRIMAGNRRTTPVLPALVVRVSPDLLYETRTDKPYYLARLAFAEKGLRDIDGLHLLPGMPVEAFIATDSRTPLQYLLKPLTEQIARTFRER